MSSVQKPQSADLSNKLLLNRYFLRERIGSGGMADIYLAWDQQRSAWVAVKILRPDPADRETYFRLFQKEADLLRKLEHPYIVRLYEFERAGEAAFLVMDWVQGRDLRQEIFQAGGPLPWSRVVSILEPVCSALNFMHQNKVFHCDIKPANILIQESDGRVLLTDFGVARLTNEKESGGTASHMAPEQIRNQRIDERTDVYGLGITMYEMLSGGKLPFRGDTRTSQGSTQRERIEWEHCNAPLPSLRKYNKTIGAAEEKIVVKALQKDPNSRYPTALSLLEAVKQVHQPDGASDSTVLRPGERPPPPPRQPDQKPQSGHGPYLVGRSGQYFNQVVPIPPDELSIGRSGQSSLRLDDRSVSRLHATLVRTRRAVYIRDNDSLAGTYVNDQRIYGPVRLHPGDLVRIGPDQVFEYRDG